MYHITTGNVLGRPQVPVTLTSADWLKFLGMDSGATAPTPFMYPGARVIAYDPVFGEAEFVLAYGVASNAVGAVVKIGAAWATTLAVASARGILGVSMAANTSTTALSWYCVRGIVPIRCLASSAANAVMYLTATAGSLDDAVVAGDLVTGLTPTTAAAATVTTKVCGTVNGSTVLPVPDINGLFVGMAVTGTGIAASSTISEIGYGGLMLGSQGPQAGTITLNNAMTATGQVTVTFANIATTQLAMLMYPNASGAA